LFVFPSLGEGMSLAVLEAMAAGLPVVAFDIPGMSQLVRNGTTGVLVKERRPEALATAVASVLADEGRAKAMGRAGQAIVRERFDIRVTVRKLEDVYLSVLGRSGQA
jgi:glycosyltransferase involved in cell wall biosynthesis